MLALAALGTRGAQAETANEIPPPFPATLLLPVVWAEAEQPHNCYLLKSIAEKKMWFYRGKKVKNQSGLNDFPLTAKLLFLSNWNPCPPSPAERLRRF